MTSSHPVTEWHNEPVPNGVFEITCLWLTSTVCSSASIGGSLGLVGDFLRLV
jgi:hypothetical protein